MLMKLKCDWWIYNEFLIVHLSGKTIQKLKFTILEELFWHLDFNRTCKNSLKI